MRHLCFLLAFVFVGLLSSAQINYFNYEDALINDNVRSLERDINGNIWIGTIAGITRFDGTSFTSYTDADGLGGSIVYDICAHSSGDVYAATSGGLSVFDGSVWTNYTIGDGLPSTTIWSVEEDNLNQIWVGTSDIGVSYFDGVNWNPLGVNDGLISAGVKVIFADRNNNIWFGTGNGLSMYDGTAFKNFNTSTGLPGLLINDIIQLFNGNIAIATNGGIGIYNFSSWSSITTAEGLPAANILALRQDYAQNLWMGTSLGLIKYDWSSFTTHNYDDGLVNDVVSKIIMTEAGNNKIWAASPFNGLTVYDQADTYIIYRTNKNLADDHVNTIYTDNENITWVGTQNGLNRVDDLHWRTYRTAEGLTVNDITTIHKDINGNIWVGTTGGLNLLNGATFDQITVADGLTNNNIYSITSDDTGVVYVATADKVNVIDAGIVIDTLDMTDGILSDVVKQVHYENGRVWFIQDAAIQYFDGLIFVDATTYGCAENQTAAGAKGLNSSLGQYFGTDYTLTYYDIDLATANCVLHPYQGLATMTSAVEFGPAIVCAFDNGEMQSFNGVWTPDVLPFDVSFIEQSYNNEYVAKRFICVIPNSIYGPNDNFDPQNSHVLSALLKKLDDARKNKEQSITLWGSGTPKREFIFSEDVADASLFLMKNADKLENSHYNLGTGVDYSIQELAQTIACVVGFKGEIVWDTTKPDGAPRKLLDSRKFLALGWQPSTNLDMGLEKTYAWYKEKYANH
ncbi:MAG: NAD-dependent epimerase/dehydratase family protein [Clostridia bacterium]|nr:NAD-dependent epimerase/dehydratase family protein [Clostridia bacterium]